ncbi:MAG: glycoside hydrolase family 3 C-terminal domain-containing protein [Candidatus Coproplasma sp.]
MRKKKLYFIFLPFVAILLALGIAVDCLYSSYSQVIGGAMSTVAKADEEYISEALENSKNVNIRLEEEGATLLKNDNGVLPVSTGANNGKVNVYGILSAHHYKGGTGSGTAESTVEVTLKDALEEAGFTVNPTIWNMLASRDLGFETGSDMSTAVAGQYELSLSTYESTQSFADAKAYSDIAIITFGSNGGEDADGDRADDSNCLQLGVNEVALLKKLHDEGFKVIALMNGSYIMEIGPVAQYADAILWIGGTGLYGPYGVANIISGAVNPSGRLVDTWMYDQRTSSTYYTTRIPSVKADNGSVTYLGQYMDGTTAVGSYTNYNEGIYVGYKWYETADAEGFWSSGYAAAQWGVSSYEQVVAYPFGYGLSYTTFSEKITDFTYSDGTFEIKVEVTNTGEVAGKNVVEIYAEKPYVNGQHAEVAKVELVAFDKTEILQPNSSETVTLTVDAEYLASYDSSADDGNGCYVLAGGEYVFWLASNLTGAHCWSAFAEEEGDTPAHSRRYTLDEIIYSGDNKRDSDYVTATNLLETTDNDTGVSCDDATAGFNQLSRKDGFANAVSTISAAANPNENIQLTSGTLYDALKSNYGAGTYTTFNADHLTGVAETTDATLDAKQTVTLSDLYTKDANGNPLYTIDGETGEKTILAEVDYDDPRWDTLLSQLSLAELNQLIGYGGYGTIAIESIGKLQAYDYDGPTGYSNFLKASLGTTQETTGFCSEPIMAATWNLDLIEEYGEAVGMEGNAFNNTGWYAPGMNIHRTPFEGRTGEYFSEDSYITGMMAAYVAYGAFQKGIYTYAKHFAFNEIETNRSNAMNCWMSEQTAREIYLRPFEIAIKQGKLTGLMTSFMYFNAQWNGGNYNLVTGIVRTEWNFKGVMNTDLAGGSTMGAERALCGGTDMLLCTSYNATNKNMAWARCDTIGKTDEGVCAMKTAAKHILYAYASAAVHRDVDAAENDSTLINALLIVANVVGYGGAAVLLGFFAWRLVLDLKSRKAIAADAPSEAAAGPDPENADPENGKE